MRASRIVDVYFAAWSRRAKLIAAVNAWFTGLWLGLLDVDDLHAIDERYYDDQSMYQAEAWNRSGLQDWEQRMVETYFGQCHRILLAGAGGGREVRALCTLGYEVDGFECNRGLVATANALLEADDIRAKVHYVARDRCLESEENYDGLVVGWSAYMLIYSRQRRVGFLKEMRKQAHEGAPLLLSFVTRSPNQRHFERIARIANAIRRMRGRPAIDTGDALAPNYVHHFTQEEIEAEMRSAGFEMECYSTRPYGHAVGAAI